MGYIMSSNAEQLRHIVEARNALQEANEVKCICSGFSLQYDGCMCAKAKGVAKAEKELQSAINALQVTAVDKDLLITNN